MGTLKGFGRLVVSFDVQDGFFYESLSLLNTTVSRIVFWGTHKVF